MFGYLRPYEPELKIKDFHYFRAHYCGLCRTMGQRLGQKSRFALSYEATFLSLLLSAYLQEDEELYLDRCIVHPSRKRLFRSSTFAQEYAADLNLLLFYYKLQDDWENDRSLKALIGQAFLATAQKRAAVNCGDLAQIIPRELGELARLEQAQCPSPDQAAEPFARIMATMFQVPGAPKAFSTFGYELGRWIYLIDAFDDLEEDLTSGSYNPHCYQHHWQGEDFESFQEKVKPEAEQNLYFTLAAVERAYQALVLVPNELLENIVILGTRHTTERILAGKKRGEGNESIRSIRGAGRCKPGGDQKSLS